MDIFINSMHFYFLIIYWYFGLCDWYYNICAVFALVVAQRD